MWYCYDTNAVEEDTTTMNWYHWYKKDYDTVVALKVELKAEWLGEDKT